MRPPNTAAINRAARKRTSSKRANRGRGFLFFPNLEAEDELTQACLAGDTGKVKEHFQKTSQEDLRLMSNALHAAAMACSQPCVKVILEEAKAHAERTVPPEERASLEAVVNARDNKGRTPVMFAAATDNKTGVLVCGLLIEFGADVALVDSDNRTAINYACYSGTVETINLLWKKGCSFDYYDKKGFSPLHAAIEQGREDIVAFLLKNFAPVRNMLDLVKDGVTSITPLCLAARQGHPGIVEILMKKGANVMTKSADWTVDESSATSRSPKIALQYAAEANSSRTCEILLSQDAAAQIRHKDPNGFSAIHFGVRTGDAKLVKTLLRVGGTKKLSDLVTSDDKLSVLVLAAAAGNTDVVGYLIPKLREAPDMSVRWSDAVVEAVKAGSSQIVELLLELPDHNLLHTKCDHKGTTLLMYAASSGHTDIVSSLLRRGCQSDDRNLLGETALFLAVKGGHLDVVTILLSAGADPAINPHFVTSNTLEWAIRSNHTDLALELIDNYLAVPGGDQSWYGDYFTKKAFEQAIVSMPSAAERMLDCCMKHDYFRSSGQSSRKKLAKNKDIKVTLDFSLIERGYGPHQSPEDSGETWMEDGSLSLDAVRVEPDAEWRKTHPLHLMCKMDREGLLLHPVVIGCRLQKWNRYSKCHYALVLSLQAVMMILLTVNSILTTPPYFDPDHAGHDDLPYCRKRGPDQRYGQAIFVTSILAMMVVVVNAIGGILHVIYRSAIVKITYSMTNYFELLIDMVTYGGSFLFLFRPSGMACEVTPWQWKLGAVVAAMGWMNLALRMHTLPAIGIYALMFIEVIRSFVTFILVVLMFVLAFAVPFHMLFRHDAGFKSFALSLAKVSVMTVGEMEYQDLFFSNPTDGSNYIDSPYGDTALLIFEGFLVIMSVIVTNMMIGVALNDIGNTINKASMRRIRKQTAWCLDLELSIPKFLRPHFVRQYLEVTVARGHFRSAEVVLDPNPNDKAGLKNLIVKWLMTGGKTETSQTEKTALRSIREEQEKLGKMMQGLRDDLEKLAGKQSEILDQLRTVREPEAMAAENVAAKKSRSSLKR